MACPMRKYPLTQPKNWQPPVPRWTLELPKEVESIFTTYIGIQQHCPNTEPDTAKVQSIEEIERWLNESSYAPEVVDTLIVTDGFDVKSSRIWVAYWTCQSKYNSAMTNLNLTKIYYNLPHYGRSTTGLWLETFTTPVPRLETNYAGLHHQPGLASLPNTNFPQHDLTAYWGAARDRMPASAYDLYPPAPESATKPPDPVPRGIGQRLIGTNYDNIVHIRSGQIWSSCPDDEATAYEETLQPVLMEGMNYLWTHPRDTGTLGLRFLQNLNENGKPIKETCGVGFFRNLTDLEQWAKRHKSHLAIFNGAHRHAKDWGGGRKFMTWHEVSVLKEGEARWEYVNCVPDTGVMRWVSMNGEVQELNSDSA